MSALGKELVENFQLLFQYRPSTECASVVNEKMLSHPDKQTFQYVMRFILDILMDGKCTIPEILITKKEERFFYIQLSENIKHLRREFPEIGLPVMTPSSMICFHGEKCREILLKITDALMLFIMKKNEYCVEMDEESETTFETLKLIEDECVDLRKEITQIREQHKMTINREMSVLRLVVSSGNWDVKTQARLLDLEDQTVISELQKDIDIKSKELSMLKGELQPYFRHIDHTYHMYKNIDCNCLPNVQISIDIIPKICELRDKSHQNFIKVLISQQKLISQIKNVNPDSKIEFDPLTHSTLLNQLGNLAEGQENSEHVYPTFEDSPICLDVSTSEESLTPTSLTPFSGRTKWAIVRKKPLITDDSLANLAVPVETDASLFNPIVQRIMQSTVKKNPNPTDTIVSIAQRMSSKVTSSKSWRHKYNLRFDGSSSAFSGESSKNIESCSQKESVKELCTPSTKFEFSEMSQTTGRRQSMGFLKPTNNLACRKLNNVPSIHKNTNVQNSSESSKQKFRSTQIDNILDKEVQEMIATANLEDSFDVNSFDRLDSSLSGIAEMVDSEVQLEPRNRVISSPQIVHKSVIAEVLEDEDLSESFNDFIGLCNNSKQSSDKDFRFEGNKFCEVVHSTRPAECEPTVTRKTGRDSINTLIEKYNAIKKAFDQKK